MSGSRDEREAGLPVELLSTERFQAILSSISDGVFTVDREGRIACFNRAAEEITGYRREDVLGRPCREVLKANICGDACAICYTQDTGEPIIDLEVTIRNRDDEPVPVSVSTALLRDPEGHVIGGVESFRDLRLVRTLRKEIDKSYTVDDIVGKSPAMRELFAKLDIVAAGGTTVLLTGETGTGKELVARALQRRSERGDGPFVAVNCGALPETLIEAELFGYVEGAFTGANRDRPGRIALAEKGTLLLDEIGDLPASVQVKLLRFLQERTYDPLGSDRTIEADVRVIAATHRSLEPMVESGEFRQDLYYRVNVIRLDIPPLRDRVEDIPLLVDHFVSLLAAKRGKAIAGVSPAAMKMLLSHPYPGNVRELENLIEHGFVLCPGGLIRPEHLPLAPPPEAETEERAGLTALEQAERAQIVRTLAEHDGNRLATAKALGIHKTTLFRKIRRLGIRPPDRDGRSRRRR